MPKSNTKTRKRAPSGQFERVAFAARLAELEKEANRILKGIKSPEGAGLTMNAGRRPHVIYEYMTTRGILPDYHRDRALIPTYEGIPEGVPALKPTAAPAHPNSFRPLRRGHKAPVPVPALNKHAGHDHCGVCGSCFSSGGIHKKHLRVSKEIMDLMYGDMLPQAEKTRRMNRR